jgi:trimethyllysine dioxygenase
MASIRELSPGPSVLDVTWDDDVVTSYLWLWLRDHSHDPETLHPVSQQRLLFTAGVPADITGVRAEVEGDALVVEWRDGGSSRLPLTFLESYRVPQTVPTRIDVDRVLWDATTIYPTPSVSYDEVMSSNEGTVRWLREVARWGFAFVTGTPATTAATEELVRRVAYVRESIFGGFWWFTADMKHDDLAYTNTELLAHTDGTYSHDGPGLQLLHCIEFLDPVGGDSTMVDGFRIAAELKEKFPEYYELLSSFSVPGQYIGDGSHLMSSRPVFRHDQTGELVQVSFNNGDRAPFLLPPDEQRAFYDALRAFEDLANDERLQWQHVLAPGEAMLFDNWRVLHGRKAYSGTRTLCGAYLNHEDFESRLRRNA